MKSRLEKVVAELEQMDDEALAAELQSYLEDLEGLDYEGPRLGRVALSATTEDEGDHDEERLPQVPPDPA